MNYKEELEKIFEYPVPEYTEEFLSKEIILYGGGSLGYMGSQLLIEAGYNIKYIVDKSVEGQINGIKVVSPDKITDNDKENTLFLICIATISYNEITSYLKSLGIKNMMQYYTYAYIKFPELLSNGWTLYHPSEEEKTEIKKVCEALSHDELSISHYLQFLWWKTRGIEKIYSPVLSGKKFFKSPTLPDLTDNEILLDGGAHFGQTIESFTNSVQNKYKNIYAFEPDLKNLEICKNKFNDSRIIYSDKAIYDKNKTVKFTDGLGYASKIAKNGNTDVNAVTIDSLNINPTIIKLHTEGDELKGLSGALATIKRSAPIIMVMADHSLDGLYKIPKFIYELPDYKLYFNLNDYCGNTAVFYGIPAIRIKKMINKKILHITPHLGGGVGSVLLNWLKYEKQNCKNNIHVIASLDYANENAKKICQEFEIELHGDMHKKSAQILDLIQNSDIVIVHFWNHPYLYDFLIRNPLPECRLIFWAHVAGFNPPYVFPEKIIDMSDKFVFTTPISYKVKEVQDYKNKNKFASILSTNGIDKFQSLKPTLHSGFNIGYIGTVDYAKMHPDFLQICKNNKILEAKFIVVGGDKELELEEEAKKLGISAELEITGKVSDITPYLSKFDVFAYPLNPNHYGTAEQVLQEAMAAGVAPVVMNNPAESYLVQHLKTGLVANNIDEFCEYILLLYTNNELRQQISDNCKKYARENFSLENLSKQWKILFDEILTTSKKQKKYSEKSNYSYFEIFLESLGNHKEPFVLYLKNKDDKSVKKLLSRPEWQSDTKGTLKQYNKFFKDDILKKLIELYN